MKITSLFLLLSICLLAKAQTPSTKQIPVNDTYFGKTVTDN
jgi:hypothetical protein